MIGEVTRWILEAIRESGPLAVFLGVIIESVIVPLPSPLIVMGAGAILVPPTAPPIQVFSDILRIIVLPGAIASALGAYVGYGLGYWGGKPLITRLQRFLGFGWPEVEVMEARLTRSRAGLMIFTLRALPVVPLSLISVGGGLLRLPVIPFTAWTFLGSVPRIVFLAYLGWFTRDTYERLAQRLDSVETAVSAGILVGAVALIVWLRRRTRRELRPG
ncbi:MAG: hypothetical protein XU14_C0003G0031 [Armatimonadetes bacterium CSP1-3]|nr:MAG: hypothetical protein XU14_C0003G0031 [Armatimonadetes bacterium CSP1-3]